VRDANREFLAPGESLEVHQARHVGGRNDLSTVANMIVQTIAAHLHGKGFFAHGERSSKAAAFIDTIEVDQLKSVNHPKQGADLAEGWFVSFRSTSEAEAAESVARRMESHAVRKPRIQALDLQYISQEFAKLVGMFAQVPDVIGLLDASVVFAHEQGTAS
jgi:hypothetical protein